VVMGNESHASVLGVGTVDLKLASGKIVQLRNMQHVPSFDDQIWQGYKTGLSGLPNRSIRFWQFKSQTKEGAKLEDPRCFEARKWTKRHQGTKIEENQARSRSHKNWTIRFAKPDYRFF
jgi:hypothetical protein